MRIKEIVSTYGAHNLRVFSQMKVDRYLNPVDVPASAIHKGGDYYLIECTIDETEHRVADGEQIKLVPVTASDSFDEYHLYYQNEFDLRHGGDHDMIRVYVLVDEDDAYQRVYGTHLKRVTIVGDEECRDCHGHGSRGIWAVCPDCDGTGLELVFPLVEFDDHTYDDVAIFPTLHLKEAA